MNNIINDIIEVENYIICIGKEIMEILQFNETQFQIIKFKEINIGNEELTCILLIQNLFFTGHKNGKISVFEASQNEFLHLKLSKNDYHKDSIVKLICKSTENSNFLISASNDQNVCVINLDPNLTIVVKKDFNFPIKDIYNCLDYEKRDNFFIVLGNGNIVVLNDMFNAIFEIKSKHNSIYRKIVPLVNYNKNDIIGDFLIISDNGFFDVFRWIKEDSFPMLRNNNNFKYNNNNNLVSNNNNFGLNNNNFPHNNNFGHNNNFPHNHNFPHNQGRGRGKRGNFY